MEEKRSEHEHRIQVAAGLKAYFKQPFGVLLREVLILCNFSLGTAMIGGAVGGAIAKVIVAQFVPPVEGFHGGQLATPVPVAASLAGMAIGGLTLGAIAFTLTLKWQLKKLASRAVKHAPPGL